jgi:glycosyltransferase involved in cell wall biosynthesis
MEDIFIAPFIYIGRLIALMQPARGYDIYFFFPFFHIGGAEKVHAQIAKATGNKQCIIYFTRKSHNDFFLGEFGQSGCVIRDISAYTDNKALYFLNLIYRGIITGRMHKQKKSTLIFNGQCNFAYKISPWVRKSIPQVELIHSFNSFSWIRIPFLPFLTRTIMISKTRIENHLEQYRKLKAPQVFFDKIQYIGNGIEISEKPLQKNATPQTLRALYVGRGTPEKRVHLIAQMAEKLQAAGIHFTLLGDVETAIPASLHPFCEMHPYESDSEKITAFYDNADVLLITSDTEGFPMVVMEAMARGCAILATPVGDLPVHIRNEANGFLFTTVLNERQVVSEGIEYLQRLKNDWPLRQKMAENNIQYAREHFSIERFNGEYRQLIHSLKDKTN